MIYRAVNMTVPERLVNMILEYAEINGRNIIISLKILKLFYLWYLLFYISYKLILLLFLFNLVNILSFSLSSESFVEKSNIINTLKRKINELEV